MNTEDIINALAKPLGAAALNQRGHPADTKTVIDKAVTELNRLNEYRFAANWSLSELRDLFTEYGMPANDRGEVGPARFAAWVVGLVDSLRRRLEEAETENRKLNDQITTLWAILKNVEGQRDAAETKNLHLREEIVFRDKTIAELEARLKQQAQPDNTPTQAVLWNRPEQFGLPPGYTINNPDNLNPDQIGEGYRIATTADNKSLPHDFFHKEIKCWFAAMQTRGTFFGCDFRTYRVPADRPLPPLENA